MRDLPKVELHLHLEGAMPSSLCRDMAKEKSVDVARIFGEDGGYRYEGFSGFLRTYEAATSVLTTPDDFARLTRAVLARSAEAGVIYTELFLSPDFCGGGDVGAWREYLAAIRETAGEMERVAGIATRGIVTAVRHFGPDRARGTALCAAETAGEFVTGFGLAGDETRFHPRDFGWPFDMAREAGLSLTAHAGEWGGPASVRDVLDHLKVARIGHGVRAIEDPRLVERLAEDGVPLEVCPGSNVALGVCRDWKSHPVERLRAAGVEVTISTDDPTFFRTDMVNEYERLSDTFGWDEDILRETARIAARAAFCDEATRDELMKRIGA